METDPNPNANAAFVRRARIASYVLAVVGVFSSVFGENTLRAIDAGSGYAVPYGVYSTAHYLILVLAHICVPVAASLFGAAIVLKRL
ncbi:hypothetical protein KNE206_43420 [Kitasatospora sp. NE20-6]|uniref:hypothetical protein n=1 Tax=Kitasatospora sp. NE20-6 TaxID=2859066 RepID=UPI0034DC3F32